MSEHRREVRQRTFLKGRIVFNNGASSMDCLVRDLSLSGARLALSQSAVLPEAFDLYIPQKEKTYRSSVRWRRSDGIGVTFADDPSAARSEPTRPETPRPEATRPGAVIVEPWPAAAAPPEAAEASATIQRLARRIGELEAENAALRQTVTSLLTSSHGTGGLT